MSQDQLEDIIEAMHRNLAYLESLFDASGRHFQNYPEAYTSDAKTMHLNLESRIGRKRTAIDQYEAELVALLERERQHA